MQATQASRSQPRQELQAWRVCVDDKGVMLQAARQCAFDLGAFKLYGTMGSFHANAPLQQKCCLPWIGIC